MPLGIGVNQHKKTKEHERTHLEDDYCQTTMRIHALFKEEEVYMYLSNKNFSKSRIPLISPGTTSWALAGAWLEHPISRRCFRHWSLLFVVAATLEDVLYMIHFIKGGLLMFTLRFMFTQVSPNDRFCFPGYKRIILRICLFIFYVATAMAQSHLSKFVKWPTHQGHVWIFHSSSLIQFADYVR